MKILTAGQIRIKVLNKGQIGKQGISGAMEPKPWALKWWLNQVDTIKGKRDMLNDVQYSELYATIEDVAREDLGPDFNDTSMIKWLNVSPFELSS